jgi:hypothetical protein
VFEVIRAILDSTFNNYTRIPQSVSWASKVGFIVLVNSADQAVDFPSANIRPNAIVEKVRVPLGARRELFKYEGLSVTFTTDWSSHNARHEVVLICDAVNFARIKEIILLPSILFGLEICQSDGSLKDGVPTNGTVNSVFMVSECPDKSRELFLLFLDNVEEPVLGVQSHVNVFFIATTFKTFSSFIVRAKRGHVPPIPDVNDYVGLNIGHELSEPLISPIVVIRVGVTVRDNQVCFTH